MKVVAGLCLFFITRTAYAHGVHEEPEKGETMEQYAQRHMASEHHIDSFDLRSFFQLHDLNQDGYWDREEIEAVYGVHHVYSQQKSKDDEEHQNKATFIVNSVLKLIDQDKDGRLTVAELETVGLDGLPSFDDLGAEGHHYDIESEFFLHHEEKYHSTPETQTEDSYNHPEDIEHFAHHEAIERKEAEKEAKFQGITVEEVLEAQRAAEARRAAPKPPAEPVAAVEDFQHPLHPHDDQQPPAQDASAESGSTTKTKNARVRPSEKDDPQVRFAAADKMKSVQDEWGQGDAGYKTPKSPVDRMRKNLPYKYKFRRNWGDF